MIGATISGDQDQQAVRAVLDEYVAAVAAGDTQEAFALSPSVPSDADLRFIEAGIRPVTPSDVSCEEPSISPELATVHCRVDVAGSGGDAGPTVTVTLAPSTEGWAITSGLEVDVRLATTFALVQSIGGVNLDHSMGIGRQSFFLFPGIYDASIITPAQIPADTVDGLAVNPGGAQVRWTGEPLPQLEQDVRETALAFLEQCSLEGVEGCPTVSATSEPFSIDSVDGGGTSLEPTILTMHVEFSRATTTGQSTLFEAGTVEVRVDFGEYLDTYSLEASLASL